MGHFLLYLFVVAACLLWSANFTAAAAILMSAFKKLATVPVRPAACQRPSQTSWASQ